MTFSTMASRSGAEGGKPGGKVAAVKVVVAKAEAVAAPC